MSALPALTVVLLHYPPRAKLALLMPCGPNRDTCTLLTRSDPKGDTGPITFPPIRSIGDTVSGVDHRFKHPLQSMERNQHSAASHQKIRFENRFKSAKTFWVSEREGKVSVFLRFTTSANAATPRHKKDYNFQQRPKIYVFFWPFKNVRDTGLVSLSSDLLAATESVWVFSLRCLSRPIYINTVSYYLGTLPV